MIVWVFLFQVQLLHRCLHCPHLLHFHYQISRFSLQLSQHQNLRHCHCLKHHHFVLGHLLRSYPFLQFHFPLRQHLPLFFDKNKVKINHNNNDKINSQPKTTRESIDLVSLSALDNFLSKVKQLIGQRQDVVAD